MYADIAAARSGWRCASKRVPISDRRSRAMPCTVLAGYAVLHTRRRNRMEMRGDASLRIAAPPETVYELVTDITRMGEWSPECIGCDWMDGHDGPVVGAQFHGHNRNGSNEWTTPNTIVVADAGREFTWV